MDDMSDLLADAPWRRFAVLGDSIAEGIGDPVEGYPQGGWAAAVATALDAARPGLQYRNYGRRGLIAEEVRETQLEAAVAFRPDLAALTAGGNDLLGPGFDGDGVEDELDAIVGELRAVGADVVTFALFDVGRSGLVRQPFASALSERLQELAERTQAVAERHGAIFVDARDNPLGACPSIYSADRRHLNARGHTIFAAEVLQQLSARSGASRVPPASPARAASRRWRRARAMSRPM